MTHPAMSFQTYLDHRQIAYTVLNGKMTLAHGLLVVDTRLSALPDDLTVQGSLNLSQCCISQMPENLCVQGALHLSRTRITSIPESLYVGGDLSLKSMQSLTLPPGFRVRGTLTLRKTPIAVLPEGLVIDEDLNLRGCSVQRFPQNLSVGGRIYPPDRMQDIDAFVAAQMSPVDITFAPTGSHHQRLALLAPLRPFPDLLTIVQAMQPGDVFRIQSIRNSSYQAGYRRLAS